MYILRNPEEVLAFVQCYSDSCITDLMHERIENLIDDEASLEELVVFVILDAGDCVENLQSQIGIQIMTPQGSPLWEVIEEHATCYELVFVLSASGYGALVFAPKLGCAPDILAMCQEYAYRSPPDPPPDAIDAHVAKDTAHRGGFFTPIQSEESHETS